jgi:HK97 family phage prohead protease
VRQLERRYTRDLVNVRAIDGNSTRIGGYAAKFDRLSQNLGGFVEQIDSRFFNKSAGDGWPGVMCRYNHSDNHLLGTTAGATLRLSIDSTGLDYECDLPAHRADVAELVTRGDVHQSSFAFVTYQDDWGVTKDDFPLRTLVSGQLIDVAPVNTPAYTDTSTGLRSLAHRVGAEFEEVRLAAEENQLRKFFGAKPAVVIDLAERGKSPETETAKEPGQEDIHPSPLLSARRADHEKKRRNP